MINRLSIHCEKRMTNFFPGPDRRQRRRTKTRILMTHSIETHYEESGVLALLASSRCSVKCVEKMMRQVGEMVAFLRFPLGVYRALAYREAFCCAAAAAVRVSFERSRFITARISETHEVSSRQVELVCNTHPLYWILIQPNFILFAIMSFLLPND